MARFTSILIACAVALVSQSVLAQEALPVTGPSQNLAPGCVIATPQEPLHQGKPYHVTFTGCQGSGAICLRSGLEADLEADAIPACPTMDLAIGSCTFTPARSGMGFSFSTTDGTHMETFSGDFVVLAGDGASAVEASPSSSKGGSAKAQSSQGGRHYADEKKKRSLYDMTGFGLL